MQQAFLLRLLTAAGTLCFAVFLSACAPQASLQRAKATAQAEALLKEALEARKPEQSIVTEAKESPIRVRALLPSAETGDVSVSAAGVPLGNLLTSLSRDHGYSVLFVEGINSARPVTIELRDLSAEAALRRIALAAGYVAVIDRHARTVTIADTASYTFRLPLHVMQRLQASFSVGGNPIASPTSQPTPTTSVGSISSGLTGTATATTNSTLQANFTVSGRYQTDSQGLATFLQQLAGRGADVQVMQELGLITVRSNAASLARIGGFLNRFSANAMRRVEIEASIVEVTLTDEFQYGIRWDRVLTGKNTGAIRLGDNTLTTRPGALDLTVSTGNITSILEALQTYTNVKVISQPKVMAMNNTPSVIFDGQQLPYLGSVSTTIIPGAGGSSTTTAGAASYAVDGVTLSIQPDIMSDSEVQLTIVPVLSRVQEFQTFDLGNTRITAPVQRSNQSLMQVVAESGKTLILGGIRSNSDTTQRRGIPGVVDTPAVGAALSGRSATNSAREVVIMLRARVIAGGTYDALFSESI